MLGRSAALLTASLLLAASAHADTIRLPVPRVDPTHPAEIELWDEVTLAEPAFVGVVLVPGTQSSCPADYAAAIALPRAVSVSSHEEHATEPPAVGSGTGVSAVLPGGAFTICGWVQPEGNTTASRPTASAGPVHFTVAGPTGSTVVHAPGRTGVEQLSIPVSYALSEQSGELPGISTAQIGAWAMRDTGGACSEGAARNSTFLRSAETTSLSAPASGAAEGSVTFTGRLVPGEYEVCSYLLPTLPPTAAGLLPNGLLGQMFGFSTATVTVLTHPLVSALRALPRAVHAGHSPRLRFTLNEQAEVAFALYRLVPRRGTSSMGTCLGDPATGRRLCGRLVRAGSLHERAGAGADGLRVPRGLGARGLRAGLYEVTATATAQDGALSPPASAVFAVLP